MAYLDDGVQHDLRFVNFNIDTFPSFRVCQTCVFFHFLVLLACLEASVVGLDLNYVFVSNLSLGACGHGLELFLVLLILVNAGACISHC